MTTHRFTTSLAVLLFAAATCMGGLTACKAQNRAPATTQQKLAALKQLHDSGVLTDDEYQQKVAALKGPAPASASRTANTAASADAHTWHLKREEQSAPLTDWQTNQSRTFKMMSMLVPVGWSMQPTPGPNFAKIDCADTSDRIVITAENPEKTLGVYVIPANASMSTSNQAYIQRKQQIMRDFKGAFNCTLEQPIGLAENLRQGAPKLFPGAQVIGSMEPVPGLSAELSGIVAGASRNGEHITAEAGRIRVRADFQGKPSEMWIVALATHRTESQPGGPVTFNDLPLLAVLFAPPGELDKNDKLLMTVLSSIEIDPDWTRNAQNFVAAAYAKINGAYATVNKIHQQMQQDNANALAQQQAIHTDVANYANKVHSAVAANRSAALDHSSQQFALYMGDQAVYKDPSTGQRVQMSSQYSHVWASTTGNTSDYVMTDSPSFDPNGKMGSSGWTQMQELQ